MIQFVNTDELTRNDTVSHTDSMDLVQSLSSEEVHKRALAARKLYGKAEKALTFWIIEMDERKLYKDFGCSNIFQYATRYLSLAEHTIAEITKDRERLWNNCCLYFQKPLKRGRSRHHISERSQVWQQKRLTRILA